MALAPRYATALKSKITSTGAAPNSFRPHALNSAAVAASSSVNGGDTVRTIAAVQVTGQNYENA